MPSKTKEEEIYMKKRILATLLCLCMVLCMIPLSASAEEVEAPKNYVALGDSIPSGYGLQESEKAFPEFLAESNAYALENLAEEGITSATLLTKLADPEVVAKVAAADVITLTVGGNDLLDGLYNFLLGKYNADKEEEEQLEKAELQEKLLNGDSALLAFAIGVLPEFAESDEVTASLTQFTQNLVKIVGTIKTANPDVAVYVTSQYNPYSYLAADQADNPLLGASLKAVAEAFESGVAALNSVITYSSLELKYTVVDVYTAFQAAEESPCNASVTEVTKINLDFHPNAYGHSLIAKVLDETINPLPFTDVEKTAWYYEAVRYAYFHGLMAGVGDNLFEPNGEVKRVMMVQVLYNLEGQPTVEKVTDKFSDLKEGDWYANAVTWAVENGVVAGNPDGTFGVKDNLTREQFAQMLYSYAGYKKYDQESSADLSKYPDGDQVSSWAETAFSWANANGLINGNDEGGVLYLDPKDSTTRGQMASILMKFCENVVVK